MSEIKYRLALDSASFVRGMGSAASSLDELSRLNERAAVASERTAQAMTRLGRMGHTATFAAMTHQAVQLADEFSNLSGRLALVSTSTAQASATQQRLFAVAQQTRTSLGSTVELYSKLATSTESMGLSQDRLIGLTRTIGQAMTLSGGDVQAMNAALMQLGQGLGSGTLRGEELNSVIEQTPALARAIAEGMGYTTAELKKLGEEGKITSAAVVRALENMAGKVEADFTKLPMTVGQGMTQLRNSLLQSLGVFDQTNGLSRGLAQGISILSQNMDVAVTAVTALAGALGGKAAASVFQAAQAAVLARAANIANTAATLDQARAEVARTAAIAASARVTAQQAAVLGTAAAASARAAAAETAHTAALVAQTAAQQAASKAAAVGAAAAGLMGGPLGIITTLLGAGVAAWAAWGSSASEAVKQASGAVAAESDTVVADLARQIDKLKERNRLLSLKPTVAGADQSALDKLAGIQARIDQLNSGTGIAAAMSAPERAANLAGYTQQANALIAQIKTLNDEQAKFKYLSAESGREKWLQQHATDAERLAAALKEARELFGAALPPDVEKRIREKFSDKDASKRAESAHDGPREAAKQWADAVGDMVKAEQAAKAAADGLTATQARMVAYLTSPAYEQHSDAMRQVVVSQYAAAVSAEQEGEANKRAAEAVKDAGKAHADLVVGMTRAAQGVVDQADRLQVEEQAAALAARQNVSLALAIEQVSIARLREKQAEMMGNEEAVLAIQKEIDARTRLMGLMAQRDGRAAEEKGKGDPAQRLDAYLNKDVGTDFAAGFDKASQSLGVFVEKLTGALDMQAQYRQALADAGGDAAKVAAVEAKHARAQINTYAAMAGAAKGFFREGSKGYKAMQATEKAFRTFELAMAVESAARQLGLIGSVTAATLTSESLKVGAVAGGQAGQTAAVAAGESARNLLKIPGVFLSYMGSLGPWGWAAAAAAVAAVMGGTHGSAADMTEQRQSANGTGTVLGDPSAKSESIANAIDLLSDVDTMTMRYSAQMLTALQSIEASMAGVATQILRAGGITTGGNMGLTTGLLGRNVGDPVLNALGLDDYTRNLPVIGGIVNTLQGLWGKTTADIIDSGLQLHGTVADLMRGAGVAQYADLRVTESSWFGLRKDRSTQTQTQDVSDEMTRQFGLIFSGVGASLQTAAEAMGQDTTRIGQQLAAYVFDIPRLSLEGLQGDALQEAIAAAVGAQADTLARTVIAGLDDWQLIGEGYYETVVRVASGSEQAQQALRGLGVAVADLADVANKQAQDVAAEIARASLVAAETLRSTSATTSRQVTETARQLVRDGYWETVQTGWEIYNENGDSHPTFDRVWRGPVYRDVATTRTVTDTATRRVLTGIGEIISTMSGSASEIADAYRALTDVRESMVLLGLSGDAVTRGLLQGAGSLDALAEGIGAFEAGFTTSQEQASAASARLKADIERLGLAMPSSAKGFADLVRGIDTSTEAGQQLLGSVLTLSDAAASVFGSISDIADERADLEQQMLELRGDTTAIRAAELTKLDAGNRALQERIWALQDEQEAAEALVRSGQSVAAFIAELRGGSSAAASLSLRRATYASDLAAAQAGDTDATTRVVASARSLVDAIKTSATDPIQLARDTSRIAAQLAALPATIAYQADQAGQAVSVPAQVATPATPVPVPAVPAAATATAQASEATALREELAALRRELEGMRSEMRARGDAIVDNTAKTHRILDAVSAGDNSFAVTSA